MQLLDLHLQQKVSLKGVVISFNLGVAAALLSFQQPTLVVQGTQLGCLTHASHNVSSCKQHQAVRCIVQLR